MYGMGQILPLEKKQYDYWQSEIARADKLRDERLIKWGAADNLKRYEAECDDGQVNDGSDFADAERKKAGLFFSTPFITVKPDPEGEAPQGMPSPALLHQELVNTVLDEQYMNAKGVALKAIQSCLTAIQPAWTKIGYVPTLAMGMSVDPVTQQPIQIPQVVHEDFFWVKLSSKAGLLPVSLKDTDYDRAAPWLGYKWRMPVSQCRRTYNIPENVVIPAASGEQELFFTDQEKPPEDADDPMCSGVYIEYKASLVDPQVVHPGLIRCLVLIDGLEQPVKHEDAPWLIDPVTKRFNPSSGFKGFSIHPLTLRDLEDSAMVPADSTLTAKLTHEVTDYLQDAKRQRESNRLAIVYDPQQLPTETVDRIKEGKTPAWIPTKPGSLAAGKDAVMVQVANLGSGREHYLGLDIFQSKREKVLGISANTVGAEDEGEKTATEISAVSRNTEARFEQERQRAAAWYLAGVRKVSALLVRYGDRLAMEVLGQQRGQVWVQARNMGLLNRFTYTVQMDSGKYMDAQVERKFWADVYNLTAKDPNVNRVETLKKFAAVAGMDASKWIVQQLPEPKPEPPKITFSVAATDLNPTLPQFPLVVKVLREGGIDLGITDVQLSQMQAHMLGMAGRSPVTGEQEQTETPDPNNPLSMIKELSGPSQVPTAGAGPDPKAQQQPQHGGPADVADRINQHQLAQTGQRSGPRV